MCPYIITTLGTNVPTGACGSEPAVLAEARGEFGSNYGKDESCQWIIQVEEHQVNSYACYESSSLLSLRPTYRILLRIHVICNVCMPVCVHADAHNITMTFVASSKCENKMFCNNVIYVIVSHKK